MNKKIIYSALTIILALVLVIIIIKINKDEEKPDEFISEPVVENHYNVYILSNEDGIIRYLEHGDSHSVMGSLDEEHKNFTGFADIVIIDGIYSETLEYRTECITGTLLGYTDTLLNIEGYGWMDMDTDSQVLRTYNDEIEICELKDYVVGATELQYFSNENGICGLVQDKQTKTDDIRVVIKNDDTMDIFYQKLYLYSQGPWTVNGEELPPAKTFDAAGYILENNLAEINILSDSPIAMTNENGKKKSEYYEGSLRVINEDPLCAPSSSSTKLVLVNTLPIETYVRYVLPSEMPTSFGYEAKKAQAVCARTYAYSQMKNGKYAAYGANLDDSTMYQVYNAKGTTGITDKVASETIGQVATCDNDLITCYYYSTSSGFTHGLEAWADEEVPYLGFHNETGVEFGDMSLSTNVKTALSEAPKTYDSDSPFYRWKATLDFSSKRIAAAKDSELGSLVSFKITGRTAGGYVNRMEITYSKGTKELESELDVRRFFGSFLTKITLNNGTKRTDFKLIPSAFFVDEAMTESYSVSNISGKKIALIGGGFGHGIGMSQYGANGMASDGRNYEEILKFYYNGIELNNVANIDAFK